jgi:nucleoside-diphosphate-sugar epimerase
MIMERTVLVTGGTGFLGTYILRELVEKGYAVRAIRREGSQPYFYTPPTILEKIEWFSCDIMDPMGLEEAMTGVDAVIHAAAKVSFADADKHELFTTNIEGTANVVNIALELGIRRLVHVSSVAALGRTKKEETVNEDKKWDNNKGQTNYAISKFYGELEVWRGIGEGLPAVIVNPSTILGVGDWNESSCAIFKSVYNEFPWYSNGHNGFVDVSDVAMAIVALMESDITGQRYILNSDNWTFRQLFNTIADGFGKKQPHREATPFLSAVAWRLEKIKSLFSGKRPLLTRESARVARSRTWFDNSKILRQLPDFRFTPLEKTIKHSCEAYKLLWNSA